MPAQRRADLARGPRILREDGAARPPRRDVARNRQALLASAAEAFSRDGVDASLEDIAHRAGVGSATLYRHFPSRDDLIAQVYCDEVAALCADVDALLERKPADQALAEWMQRFVGRVMSKRGMAAALRGAASRSEPFEATRSDMLRALTHLIERGAAQNLLRADANVEDAMKAMSAFCLLGEPGLDSLEQAQRLVDLLVDGLRHGGGVSDRRSVV